MQIPEHIQAFWEQLVAVAGEEVNSRFLDAYYFDDNEATANKLADLVLRGQKRATAGLLWAYEAEGDSLPQPGDLSVITRWDGTPVCVVEVERVDVVPYDKVSAEFAAVEGEGDGSLRYWREVHWDFFTRECQKLERLPDPKMPVICERFRVVYKPSSML